MNSLYKGLLPLTAIALIGFAGAPVAIAQAPTLPPFTCAPGEWSGKAGRGINDNFAGGSEPTAPSPDFQNVPGLNLNQPTNVYDQTTSNYHFGDTVPVVPPPGYTVTKIRLTTHLKPNSSDATNDGIDFASHPFGTPTPGARVAFAINSLPGAATWAPPHPAELFVFDFDPSTFKVYGNNIPGTPTPSPAYSGPDFFKALNQNKRVDMYVQDDTSVDYIQLEICAKPGYDLVATKKHEGSAYTLDVTNAGQAISPSGSIQVVEVVPPGLTIAGIGAPSPWTCTGSFPMVGPDSFTCTYPINAVIPNGQHLPQIVLKSEGTPECPNCMRAHLYLKEVSGGQKPVEESDMKNNASCAK